MAIDVANGLAYLASNGFVHRDLAARNCLVSRENRVKISDFGMSREICGTSYYKMGTETLVPVRWLPPESILYRKFTVESDVWSFGVLLWEIFSLGQVPWGEYSNSQVFDVVKSCRLLPRPDDCPREFFELIILNCWKIKANQRLTAAQLRSLLETIRNHNTKNTNNHPDHPDSGSDSGKNDCSLIGMDLPAIRQEYGISATTTESGGSDNAQSGENGDYCPMNVGVQESAIPKSFQKISKTSTAEEENQQKFFVDFRNPPPKLTKRNNDKNDASDSGMTLNSAEYVLKKCQKNQEIPKTILPTGVSNPIGMGYVSTAAIISPLPSSENSKRSDHSHSPKTKVLLLNEESKI